MVWWYGYHRIGGSLILWSSWASVVCSCRARAWDSGPVRNSKWLRVSLKPQKRAVVHLSQLTIACAVAFCSRYGLLWCNPVIKTSLLLLLVASRLTMQAWSYFNSPAINMITVVFLLISACMKLLSSLFAAFASVGVHPKYCVERSWVRAFYLLFRQYCSWFLFLITAQSPLLWFVLRCFRPSLVPNCVYLYDRGFYNDGFLRVAIVLTRTAFVLFFYGGCAGSTGGGM